MARADHFEELWKPSEVHDFQTVMRYLRTHFGPSFQDLACAVARFEGDPGWRDAPRQRVQAWSQRGKFPTAVIDTLYEMCNGKIKREVFRMRADGTLNVPDYGRTAPGRSYGTTSRGKPDD